MANRTYRLRGTPDCPIAVYPRSLDPNNLPDHWHPEVEILLTTQGTAHFRLDDREVYLSAGDILILNPNQLHTAVELSEDHQSSRVIFSLDVITMPNHHIFQTAFVGPLSDGRLQLPNILRPDHPAHTTVRSILEALPQGNIYLEESRLHRYTSIVAICTALQPYCTLTRSSDRRQDPEERTVGKAMIFIHNFYNKPLSLQRIAKHVHLHPNYLSAVFKEQTGHTVTEHIAQTRVDAAKFLLRRDALPMARVAELSGFPSERSFYRQFRKITGITPKAYQLQQTGAENQPADLKL